MRRTQRAQQVLAFLQAHPGYHFPQDVATHTGIHKNTAYVCLNQLVEEGAVLVEMEEKDGKRPGYPRKKYKSVDQVLT